MAYFTMMMDNVWRNQGYGRKLLEGLEELTRMFFKDYECLYIF